MDQRGIGNTVLGIAGLVVIVAAIGVGATFFNPNKSSQTTTDSPSPSTTPTATPTTLDANTGVAPTPTAATSGYKDGTYAARGTYESPGGEETVSVNLTLKGGVITGSTVTTTGNNPTGKTYQDKFIAGYKPLITGKSIDAVRLSRVSGSSLTSAGFNDAVAQIRAQAKA